MGVGRERRSKMEEGGKKMFKLTLTKFLFAERAQGSEGEVNNKKKTQRCNCVYGS